MKKALLTTAILAMLLMCGCMRNKKCEYGYDGTWLYLEQPRNEVVGYFIPNAPNLDIDSACYVLLNNEYVVMTFAFYPVKGPVPKEFRLYPNKPIPVHCTLEYFTNYHDYYTLPPTKILCLEKI